MFKEINVAIGFTTGRANVCEIINNYYKKIIKQIKHKVPKINLTIFILYDLKYQSTKRDEFYKIIPEVHKKINIQYITPEEIIEEKKMLISKHNLKKEDLDLFLRQGYAKGRNTILYYALKNKLDYLFFWDDDEYPVANIRGKKGEIIWKEQKNLLRHIKHIKKSDVTIGYHCGYISPIPYIDYHKEIPEEIFKNYIEAISIELFSWDTIKEKFENTNGVTYANKQIAEGKGQYEILKDKGAKWVSGSTLCINLNNINRIPAFYNPPEARGEDSFFSVSLNNTKVIKIPVYHFHDGFLKYTSIMKENYPKKLRKIRITEEEIEKRFLKASIGWIRYKPLLIYILDREHYNEKIEKMKNNLELSVPYINKLFPNSDFKILQKELDAYSENSEKYYKEFINTNKIWNKIKKLEINNM